MPVRRLFALPGFGRLCAAYALNELAWFVGTLSLSLLVYRRTGSTLGTAAFFLCSQAAPALVAPVLVGRLDRASPRRLLPAIYWTEAILFGLLAWLAHRFLLGPVLVVVVFDGVLALTARSLASGARSEILKPVGLVREGGALQSMLFSTAYLVGPLLAGGVAAVGGTVAALVVNCVVFAVVGISLVSPAIPRSIVHEGPERGRLRAAIAYARGHRPVASLLALETVAISLFSIPTPIEVVLTVHTLHAGSAGYGGLMAAWGGGAVLGSLAYMRWRRIDIRLLIGSATIMLAIGFAVMAVSPDIVIALVGAGAAGVGNGITGAGFATELMEIVPQSWNALVLSLSQSLGVLAPGVGVAVGGILSAVVGVRVTFGIAAGGSAAVSGLVMWLLTPARMAPPPGAVTDEEAASEGVAVAAHSGVAAGRADGAPEEIGVRSEPDAPSLA